MSNAGVAASPTPNVLLSIDDKCDRFGASGEPPDTERWPLFLASPSVLTKPTLAGLPLADLFCRT